MGKIFFVLGKSCSGKDTIFKKLKKDEKIKLKTIIGYTTRPMREGEHDGEEYHFVDSDVLNKLNKSGKVIECREYNTVYGLWNYFTVDDGQIDLNKNSYLYIGTLESYKGMKEYFGEEYVIPIYIEVENGERLSRALNRERQQSSPKYKELCRRFIADEEDFTEEKIADAGIRKKYQNIDLESCVEKIRKDIVSCI